MNKNIFILILFFMLLSCSEDMLIELSKTDLEPVKSKPTVNSFEQDDFIKITWKKDIGADEYVLYRSELPSGFYNEIYRGSNLIYNDYVGEYEIGKFFYYKLAKKRESQIYPKSDFSCGVVAEMSNDNWENNNSFKEAKCIDGNITIYGTMWLYRDNYNNVLVDHDYFRISVEPKMSVKMMLNFENKPLNTSWDNYVYLYSSYSDNNGEAISESNGFRLFNTFDNRKELSFQLYVNKEGLFNDPVYSGKQCISYSLSNVGSKPITPQEEN